MNSRLNMLEWTGERFLPHADPAVTGAEIHYEHLHRYAFASQFVRGKKVIDLASGEGYGAFLLSEHARCVVGIEIDQNSIDHARETYPAGNIRFEQGSVLDIPIQGRQIFDVVVCFETIEHIGEVERLFAEIRRLMKEDGYLIVSTPNRKAYSDDPKYRNPFHKKEYYYDDFLQLLKTHFSTVYTFGQRVVSGSSIYPLAGEKAQSCSEFVIERGEKQFLFRDESIKTPLYFVAIASNHDLAQEEIHKSYLVDNSETRTALLNKRISEYAHEVEGLGKSVAELTGNLAVKDAQLKEAAGRVAELTGNLEVKTKELHELFLQVASLRDELNQIKKTIIWQLSRSFHNRIIVRLFPDGTERRRKYDLSLKGARILFHDGWGSFIYQFRERRRVKKLEILARARELERTRVPVQNLVAVVEKDDFDEIRFPLCDGEPDVSIVIPAYNQAWYTYNCLQAIRKRTRGRYEVIVVDDASTDITGKMLKIVKNITLITNEKNAGFIASSNRGASAGRGRSILFLNNDTVVTPGWLDPLLDTIKKEKVGAVGGKILYPNGLLQEAGGIIWNDASGWNYGRLDNPEKPEYNFVREVDYCSGSALLVKRDLFEALGGFDVRFKPGYYEDADLSFSLWNAGYRVLYQPKSEIIHFEGITSGTSTDAGMKKYQEINRGVFFEKWRRVLEDSHLANDARNVFAARSRKRGRQILVIDHYIPTFDRDAGSYRIYNLLNILTDLGNQVTFIGDNLQRIEPYTTVMQQSGIEVIYRPYTGSVESYLREHGGYFDVVLISRAHIALKYIMTVRQCCPRAKIIFDTVDLQFLRLSRQARLEDNPALLKESELFKNSEIELARTADVTWVVSPVEKELLLKEDPSLRVDIVSTIHEVQGRSRGFAERQDLMFIGGFAHPPNIDAMKWFISDIFPLIRDRIPGVRMFIVGSDPPPEIRSLSSGDVIVTGHVRDVSEYFEKCRLFVAPLRYGAGIKGKINQSMSYGLPVVTTTTGAEGMELTEGKDILIADSPESFARKCIDAYNIEPLWEGLSESSIIHVREHFSIDHWKPLVSDFINALFAEEATRR